MNISGSGHIPAGEYQEKVSISGSGKIDGNLRCLELSCSGAARAEGEIECVEKARFSGSAHLEKGIRAKSISASGALKVGGSICVQNDLHCSGGVKCGGNLKAGQIKCSGAIEVANDIETEYFDSSGRVICKGLLNAERINISIDGTGSEIGSIGGSEIKIYCERTVKRITRMPLLSKLVGGTNGTLTVHELIEGDTVALESVKAPRAVGRVVAIGADCEISLVQYSEEIEIHPDAKVGKCEKI